METRDLRGCSEDDLIEICEEIGLKRFRASQLFQWVQQKAVRTWEDMKNLGARDRLAFSSRLSLNPLEKVREQRSHDGTRKYLFRLHDGETIECVLMDYARTKSRDRHTAVSYTHLRAHETRHDLVCRLL